MTEKHLQQLILKTIGCLPEFRLFRNNVGMLLDINGTPVKYGLCVGSSDIIGLKAVTITEEMVGQQIAQFVSIEVKSEKGKLSPAQENWLQMVEAMGGVAVVIKSITEINKIIREEV